MAFPDRFLDELNDRTDIAELVSRYVPLQKRGNRHVGLCPFHNEKTPSFTVTPERQMFYCFGCGAGGGALQFVMRVENLDFPNAVRFLAEKAGMTVPESGEDARGLRRDVVYTINREAALFFVQTLHTPEGEKAYRYLLERGFTKSFIKRFGIGAAPDKWDALMSHLLELGYDKLTLTQAGVLSSGKNGQLYDRFRNRVVFPILDLRKNVIGFTARVLDDSLPKYINSPDSAAYAKNRHLFALHAAKDAKTEQMLLCEGCMDVLALHQAGFPNTVASLGTSLTEHQAKLISQYAKEAVIIYDSDAAGQKAATRATGMLTAVGLNVRILRLNGAKDPDEYIKRFGRDAFELLLRQAESHLDYKLGTLMAQFDLTNDTQRLEFSKSAVAWLSDVESPLERDVYIARAAQAAGVGRDAMKTEVERLRKRRYSKAAKERERRLSQPESVVQPKSRSLRFDDPGQAAAEQTVIQNLLLDPSLLSDECLDGSLFTTPLFRRLYDELSALNGERLSLSSLGEHFSPEEIDHVARLMGTELLPDRSAMRDCIAKLRNSRELLDTSGLDPILILQKQKQKEMDGGHG